MDRDYAIPRNWKLTALPTREAYGLIWLWHGDDEPTADLPWFEELPTSESRSWQTDEIWPYHYTRLMDSNFDIYHFPFVHRSINPGLGPVVVEQDVQDLGDVIRSRATLDRFADERRAGRGRKTFVINVRMPNLLYFEMTERLLLLAIMTPVDADRTWVFARYYAEMPLGGLIAWAFGRFEYKIVQDQDKRIMDTLPKGPVERGEYTYGKVDAGSILWQQKRARMIKAAASSKSPGQPVKED